MALEVKVGIENTKTQMFVTDTTGDYDALTNPTGFGVANPPRSSVGAIVLHVTQPDGTVLHVDVPTTLANPTATTVDVTNPAYAGGPVLLMDGVYEFDAEYTVSGTPYNGITYSLRTYDLDCTLGQLALGDLCKTDFKALKLEYDRMQQAFLCENYVLAEEIYADIQAMLTDCNGVSKLGCGCGC